MIGKWEVKELRIVNPAKGVGVNCRGFGVDCNGVGVDCNGVGVNCKGTSVNHKGTYYFNIFLLLNKNYIFLFNIFINYYNFVNIYLIFL